MSGFVSTLALQMLCPSPHVYAIFCLCILHYPNSSHPLVLPPNKHLLSSRYMAKVNSVFPYHHTLSYSVNMLPRHSSTSVHRVILRCFDEYWYYSSFTHCVRVHCCMAGMSTCDMYLEIQIDISPAAQTLTEFRKMFVVLYFSRCPCDSEWVVIKTDELLPGDAVSAG